jgi:hypothetical protein
MSSILSIKNAESFRNAVPLLSQVDSLAELANQLRTKTLAFISYQAPEKIIAGYELIGHAHIFESVSAAWPGPATTAEDIKRYLASYVKRRNQIAHEGDMEPNGTPRPMQPAYSHGCRDFIVNLTWRLNRVVYGT